ncbi:hypothetical protein DRE_00275 [Drechslerella stenobrocha 248]|uniref:VPS9 domain-containing protein n=1 Tax=Drechslerella stenobrocha 248 TaxID=1043628 RepID=W7II51_9PEZI|nr:hypothetical protein DRE_00275 [Drechslerella stenobrocha 248]
MQDHPGAANYVDADLPPPPPPPPPQSTKPPMTDRKRWDEPSTSPAAMPVEAGDALSADAEPALLPPPVPISKGASAESYLSTSLARLDISPTRSPTRPLHESLAQELPSSPPAPAPPPKDKPLPAPDDVLAKAETAHLSTKQSQQNAPPALPPRRPENGGLHPGYSGSGGKSHNRSMSGSSILDADEEESQDTKGEIQNIMLQFSSKLPLQPNPNQEKLPETEGGDPPSTSLSNEKPPLSPIPPRTSSLENLMTVDRPPVATATPRSPASEKPMPPSPLSRRFSTPLDPHSPADPTPPPPGPDPEPPQPFDFHRFLEQLRHRTADPVARFLRSFLGEFGKRQWQVHEQVKIISDFLEFIHGKMAMCEVWREVSDAEFDNAKEGMEKLVMNRLYKETFSPEIPPQQSQDKRNKRRPNPNAPGRRGQHQEDVERDEILSQKVKIYGWVREEHLDIEAVGESGRKFLSLACQEILKINNYRAPRDKVICVLNCCKVIFGLLRHANSSQSADNFVPLLIYVLLRSNPEHLVSNIQYILRFRNPDKLGGEAGYYLSSLSGAIQFIEGLDRNSLTIDDAEFERNVEEAVKMIAEKREPVSPVVGPRPRGSVSEAVDVSKRPSVSFAVGPGDSERTSTEQRRSLDSRPGEGSTAAGGVVEEEKAAVAGLLQTLQRPLSTIGRIFLDDSSTSSQQPPPPQQQQQQQQQQQARSMIADAGPVSTPLPGNTPRTSPGPGDPTPQQQQPTEGFPGAKFLQPAPAFDAAESAARQASAETAEAMRIQAAEHENVVGILASMFPDLDKDIIDDVVRMKEGRVGLAVDACLALSS